MCACAYIEVQFYKIPRYLVQKVLFWFQEAIFDLNRRMPQSQTRSREFKGDYLKDANRARDRDRRRVRAR